MFFFGLQIYFTRQLSVNNLQKNRLKKDRQVIQRVTTIDNDWQRITMSGTTSDNEWQRVITCCTTSDNE